MRNSREEISDEEYRVLLLLKRRLYRFQLKKGLSVAEHMNNYTKLLAGIVNVDVNFEKEDKALIMLNSLPDEEFETFVLTLINGRQSLNYNDESTALVNYEVRRKDKQFFFQWYISRDADGKRQRFQSEGKDESERFKSRPDFRDQKNNQCIF